MVDRELKKRAQSAHTALKLELLLTGFCCSCDQVFALPVFPSVNWDVGRDQEEFLVKPLLIL